MRNFKRTLSPAALDRNGFAQAQQLTGAGELVLNGALSNGYDRNGICTAQTPAAAGTMTLNGALVSGSSVAYMPTQRRALIYSDGNDSGVSFSFVGKDDSGYDLFETITGPNTGYVFTSNKYAEITSVTISAAGTGNIEVGSDGVGVADIARHVGLYCAGDISAVTFVVYGLDRNGNDINESVTGPNATTVETDNNFLAVTRVTASAAVGTNVEVGTTGKFESGIIPLPRRVEGYTVAVTLSSSASLTYTIQHTLSDLQDDGFVEDDANFFNANGSDLVSATASKSDICSGPVSGMRVAVESYSSGTIEIEIVAGEY